MDQQAQPVHACVHGTGLHFVLLLQQLTQPPAVTAISVVQQPQAVDAHMDGRGLYFKWLLQQPAQPLARSASNHHQQPLVMLILMPGICVCVMYHFLLIKINVYLGINV